jgi:hypothetical protein
MRHLIGVLPCMLVMGCVTPAPVRRDVTVSSVRLNCPSLGTVSARTEEELRAAAAARGANHVIVTAETTRSAHRFARTAKRETPMQPQEAYFAGERWFEGEAVRCGGATR